MINVNQQTIGGVVEDIRFGHAPMPWMMMKVKAGALVWDRHGKRTSVYTRDLVVIQGQENVATYRALITKGTPIFAMGQRTPAFAVANDACIRATVLLATILQLQEQPCPTKM